MDFIPENMTAQEMLEKIAQLDYSKSLLRDENTEMRRLLDAADEDIATLRSENIYLKRQVKEFEKCISDAHIMESVSSNHQPDYIDLKIRNEMTIQKLEKESASLKEENKKLTAEIRNMEQLQDQDGVNLNKLKVSLQILESKMANALLEIQQRDEIIQQKHQELKIAEEVVEEYLIIVKELRFKNQQLKDKLEAGQDEVSFAIAIDLLEAKEKDGSPILSFAEELKMLDSSFHKNLNLSDITQIHKEAVSMNIPKIHCSLDSQSTDSINEESSGGICTNTSTICTEQLKLQAFPIAKKNKSKQLRYVGLIVTVTERVILVLGILFLFFVLAVITSESFSGNFKIFYFDSFWNGVRFLLQPYCSLYYGGMPPM